MKTRLSKTTSIIAIVSLLAAGTAFAQNPRGGDRDWQEGPPSVEEKLARISAALDLSNEQAVAMLVILQEQAENRAALHEQTMALLGPEICAQRAETAEAILAILTPEQAELFQQHKEERLAKGLRKGRGKRGAAELDCSD